MIWLSFMVHLCKMIKYTGIFYILWKFWFSALLGSKRAKNGPEWDKMMSFVLHISRNIHHTNFIFCTKWQKILSVALHISGTIHIWSSFVICKCKMIVFSSAFFIFSKFWFFKLLRRLKGKKLSKMTENFVCHALYLRNHTSYYFHSWYTCVIE